MEISIPKTRFAPAALVLIWTGLLLPLSSCLGAKEIHHPNVLFIAVDDLRPELASYGKSHVHAPNIDHLAEEGILFERAFVQVPVCGASRASLLSGLHPTRIRFINYLSTVNEDAPGVRTLPEHFKNHGYVTIGNGKIFHTTSDAPEAWSEPAWRPGGLKGNWRDYALEENVAIAATHPDGRGPAFESAEVADSVYADGKIATKSLADLRRLAAGDMPFFLAVGFLKPHLPFNAPRKYWDLYEASSLALANNPFPPEDAPDNALHNWGELRNYFGIPAEGPLSEEMSRTMIHGYLASTSYTDALIGLLLDELDRLEIAEETIVVVWGDHGWQLGEHGLWCKHCTFETSLHAPLIMRVPGTHSGVRITALTEFVDIYPTLSALAGLPIPSHLDGINMLPVIEDPTLSPRDGAFSRYRDGESYRTDRYRYTEFENHAGEISARMLYDFAEDPDENVNLANRPEYQDLVSELSRRLAEVHRAH